MRNACGGPKVWKNIECKDLATCGWVLMNSKMKNKTKRGSPRVCGVVDVPRKILLLSHK